MNGMTFMWLKFTIRIYQIKVVKDICTKRNKLTVAYGAFCLLHKVKTKLKSYIFKKICWVFMLTFLC